MRLLRRPPEQKGCKQTRYGQEELHRHGHSFRLLCKPRLIEIGESIPWPQAAASLCDREECPRRDSHVASCPCLAVGCIEKGELKWTVFRRDLLRWGSRAHAKSEPCLNAEGQTVPPLVSLNVLVGEDRDRFDGNRDIMMSRQLPAAEEFRCRLETPSSPPSSPGLEPHAQRWWRRETCASCSFRDAA